MKIAVVGPGALGCFLAARLYLAGEDVSLADYRPQRAALLRRQGIRLQSLGGELVHVPVPARLAAEVSPGDLVLITVKAHQTAVAASFLPALLRAGGLVLTLQNGLGNLEQLAAVVGPNRLLAGVTFLGVTRRHEGEIVHAGQGPTFIGAPAGAQVAAGEVEAVVDLFNRAGLECRARGDIEALLWEKLVVNVGINPLTALLQVPNGVLPELPEVWKLAVAVAREAAAVAGAAGVELDLDPEERLLQVCRATAANRSSMLQDVLAGRPTEIEALNAQVVARGTALGIATPVNEVLTRLLRGIVQGSKFKVDPHPPPPN